jgi:hypothetical protein
MIPCQLIYKTESFSYNVVFLSIDMRFEKRQSRLNFPEFFVRWIPEPLTRAEPLEQLF